MISHSTPSMTSQSVFDTCVSIIRDQSIKQALRGYTTHLGSYESTYKLSGSEKSFHNIPLGLLPENHRPLFYELYDRLGKSSARKFYDELLESAPDNKCLFCGQRSVSQLDHYLPRATYQIFSVLPLNLVPVCPVCNYLKHQHTPTNSSNTLFHPYFDDLSIIGNWVGADLLIHNDKPVVKFFIKSTLDRQIFERLDFTFTKLELAHCWSDAMAPRIIEQARALTELVPDFNSTQITSYLSMLEKKASTYIDKAFYQSLWKSEWFINGGFKMIV